MARFNGKETARSPKTTNLAGGVSYKLSPEEQYVSILLTSFVQSQYYKSKETTLADLLSLMDDIQDKRFLAQAAIYARDTFGMRTITHVVAAELANRYRGRFTWMRRFVTSVCLRVDDMMEIAAYSLDKYKKPLPHAIKDGIAKAFQKFDAYQFGKYQGKGRSLKLLDLLVLTHPKPVEHNGYVEVSKKEYWDALTDGMKKKEKIKLKDLPKMVRVHALRALVLNLLKAEGTVMSEMTKAGQQEGSTEEKQEARTQAWESLILNKKIGYMALIKNLVTIVTEAPNAHQAALDMVVNPKLIAGSRMFPFRFWIAYRHLLERNAPNVFLQAIAKALDISCQNIPRLDGRTLVVCDYSGSMDNAVNDSKGELGRIAMRDLGTLFGVTLAKRNLSDLMIFGSRAKYVSYNPDDTTMSIVEYCGRLNRGMAGYSSCEVGHGTNFSDIFEKANRQYDRIVIFSDMQGWQGGRPMGAVTDYEKRLGCKPFIYSMDLAGYGTVQFPGDRTVAIAGFSEKIFDLMKMFETDKVKLVEEIKKIKI